MMRKRVRQPLKRFLARVEYDGTNYFGFQRQRASQPTVQSVIEKSLGAIFQHDTPIVGSGRTDRGVHALGQVISFDASWNHGEAKLRRAANANLPLDIVFHDVQEVSPTFHPRFDAKRRAYIYYIYNSDTRSPTKERYNWHVRQPLDMSRMKEAAALLIGEHDFATFGQPPQGNNSVRCVFAAEWQKVDDQFAFYIQANAFLYRMVRSIVGCLKAVGSGEWRVEEFEAAFFSCERGKAFKTAPPNGLFLTAVDY